MGGMITLAGPILLTAFLTACMGVIDRYVLKGKSSPSRFLAWKYALVSLGLVTVYVANWGFTWPQNLHAGFWSAVFVGLFANYGIQYLTAKAFTYKEGELSKVSILSAMTPGFVTLLAFLLGELPGPVGAAGIAFMVAGSWILLFPDKPEHWTDYLGPLYRLRLIARWSTLSQQEKEKALVVWMALGGAALSTIGLLCDGLYSRRGGDLQGMWLGVTVLLIFLSAGFFILYFMQHGGKATTEWKNEKLKFYLSAGAFACLSVTAYWFLNPLWFETYIGYIGTLTRLRIIFAVALAWLIFKDQDIKKRWLAAIIIVIGALLIGSEDLPDRITDKLILFGL